MFILYTIAITWAVLALVIVALLIASPGRPERNQIKVRIDEAAEFEAIVAVSYPQHRVEQAFRSGPFGGAK